DAGGLAVETRSILALEIRGRLFASLSQFGSAIQPRTFWCASAFPLNRTSFSLRAGFGLIIFVLIQCVERHQPAAGTARVDHDPLHFSPVARDVRFARRAPQGPVDLRHSDWAPDFLDTALGPLDVLP